MSAATATVPVVLPQVVVDVDENGHVRVSVDGRPYPLAPEVQRAGRAAVKGLVEQIAAEAASPARVVVLEADGSRFTDVVAPTPPASPAPEPEPEPLSDPAKEPVRRLPVLAGHGFLPGEPVAIAVVVATQTATGDGYAGLRLPAALLDGRSAVLFGETSGNLIVLTALETPAGAA